MVGEVAADDEHVGSRVHFREHGLIQLRRMPAEVKVGERRHANASW